MPANHPPTAVYPSVWSALGFIDAPKKQTQPPAAEQSLVEELARELAKARLASWLDILDDNELAEIADGCEVDKSGDRNEIARRVVPAFVESYVRALVDPGGGLVPSLNDKMSPQEVGWKVELFWRAAIALHKTPLAQIRRLLKDQPAVQPSSASTPAQDRRHHLLLRPSRLDC